MEIRIEKETIDNNTKTLWTRIYVESDDGKKGAIILVGASRQYCLYQFGVETIEDFPFDTWIKAVANK